MDPAWLGLQKPVCGAVHSHPWWVRFPSILARPHLVSLDCWVASRTAYPVLPVSPTRPPPHGRRGVDLEGRPRGAGAQGSDREVLRGHSLPTSGPHRPGQGLRKGAVEEHVGHAQGRQRGCIYHVDQLQPAVPGTVSLAKPGAQRHSNQRGSNGTAPGQVRLTASVLQQA